MIFYLGNKAQDKIPENIRVSNNRVKNWKYGYNQEYDVIIISKDGTLGSIFKMNGLYIGLPEPPADKKKYLDGIKQYQADDGLEKNCQRDFPKALNTYKRIRILLGKN